MRILEGARNEGRDGATDSSRPSESTPSLKRWLHRVGLVLVGLVVTARATSVVTAPLLTNDSLGYLRAAEDPSSWGLIEQGYRQIAYPLVVRIVGDLGSLFGLDRLFAIVATQRLLFLSGLLALWGIFGWWSLPVALFFSSATMVAMTDLVLIEGLVPGLAVWLGVVLALSLGLGRFSVRRRTRVWALGTAGAIVLVLAALKLQFAALVLALGGALLARSVRRSLSRRTRMVLLGLPVVSILFLAGLLALENHAEYGTFQPVTEHARARWYGAYQAVFRHVPDNQKEPALQEFYDAGNLYGFLHGLESSESKYEERADVIDERIDQMFETAGTSRAVEVRRSFVGAFLFMGRTDDVAGMVNRVVSSGSDDPKALLEFNSLGQERGAEVVEARYNDGDEITSIRGLPWDWIAIAPLRDFRTYRGPFLGVSLAVLLLAAALRSRNWTFPIGVLAAHAAVSAALATAYIDNLRYLIGTTMIVTITAAVFTPEVLLQAKKRLISLHLWSANRS